MRILVVILFLLSFDCFSQPDPSKIDSLRAAIADRSTRLRASQDSFLRIQESLQRARVAMPAKKHDTTARTVNISQKISEKRKWYAAALTGVVVLALLLAGLRKKEGIRS